MRGVISVVAGLMLGLCASAQAAGPSSTCQTLERAYLEEMSDLARLEQRPPRPEFPETEWTFWRVLLHPYKVALIDLPKQPYDAAIPAQQAAVSALIGCGRERSCAWASVDDVGMSRGGAKVAAGECHLF